VGGQLVEFEFQRYKPRKILTDLLNTFDLVQIVAGSPALAWAVHHVQRPQCLFFATVVAAERGSLIKEIPWWRKAWVGLMNRIVTSIEKQALKSMDCVFAESYYSMQLAQSFQALDTMRLALPGIDTSLFLPSHFGAEGPILSIGRFGDPRKNVRLLFQAYAMLRQQCASTPQLILAGRTMPSPDDLAVANSLGILGNIEMLENITLSQLADLYRQASLFVLPSNEEGLGIAIMEAMASGLAVISTDCGGPSTVIENGVTGYLTPVGDATRLAYTMRRLVEDAQLRQQMGRAGRQHAERCFSVDVAGQVYLDQYDRLLLSSLKV
jgi:glycosyltransferase involved in cell wall biosynthesis